MEVIGSLSSEICFPCCLREGRDLHLLATGTGTAQINTARMLFRYLPFDVRVRTPENPLQHIYRQLFGEIPQKDKDDWDMFNEKNLESILYNRKLHPRTRTCFCDGVGRTSRECFFNVILDLRIISNWKIFCKEVARMCVCVIATKIPGRFSITRIHERDS